MAAVTVTYSFINGQTSDGTQVNQNFTDILNGLSDGTKTLTVSAIAATTLTASGFVVLGASGIKNTAEAGLVIARDGQGSMNLISADATKTRWLVNNSTATGSVQIFIQTDSTSIGSTGDNVIIMQEGGSTTDRWAFGRDDSDSGTFKISQSNTLGTNDFFSITTGGLVTIGTGTATQHALNTLLAANGVQLATIGNLPAAATAGAAFGWLKMTINGTTSYLPFWH